MRYVVARLEQESRDQAYRIFVTEALKAITENTAHYVGMSGLVKAGMTLTKSYQDILNPDQRTREAKKEETRSGEEIISDIKNKLKKMGGGKG